MKPPYKLKDGSIVPGVTTITGQYPKPESFLDWVWGCGKKKKPWRGERDYAGKIGKLAHALVMSYWTKEEVSLSGYTLGQCDIALHCADKIHSWGDLQDIEPILIEHPLISEKYRCGGQPDLYVRVISSGKIRRIDIKTSGGIYYSHWLQLAGYDILGIENDYPADEHQILWLPKDDRFDDPIRTDLRREKRIFKYLLGIHKERKANEPPF